MKINNLLQLIVLLISLLACISSCSHQTMVISHPNVKLKNGTGIIINCEDSSVAVLKFKDYEKHGKAKHYFKNGEIIYSKYRKGNLNGWIKVQPFGKHKKVKLEKYKNGKLVKGYGPTF